MDGEALEVAEDQGQAEGIRQSIDLDVQRLGLLEGQDRPIGRDRGVRRARREPLFLPSPAADLEPGETRRAEGNTIEPVAQQVGFTDGTRFPGQDEEGGLEGVLGVMAVAQDLSADTEHHRPVSGHQRGERRFAGVVAPSDEAFEELTVG